jgi:hypothetical protein
MEKMYNNEQGHTVLTTFMLEFAILMDTDSYLSLSVDNHVRQYNKFNLIFHSITATCFGRMTIAVIE